MLRMASVVAGSGAALGMASVAAGPGTAAARMDAAPAATPAAAILHLAARSSMSLARYGCEVAAPEKALSGTSAPLTGATADAATGNPKISHTTQMTKCPRL